MTFLARKLKALMKTATLALLVVTPSSAAVAGIYTDDLTRCLVKSASDADKIALMQWVFFAMALHPAVKDYASITADQQTAMSRKVGGLFERLLTSDCRTETIAALKYEGAESIKGGFSTLGQIAMTGLLSDPNVVRGTARLDEGIDKSKMNELDKEAGLSPAPKP